MAHGLSFEMVVNVFYFCFCFHHALNLFPKMQIVQDFHLVLFVLGLVVIDVIILAVYFVVEVARDNLRPSITRNKENPLKISGVSVSNV